MQTIKNLLNKCDGDGIDHYLASLQLRATPIDSRLPSLSKLLQISQPKTTLPAIIKPPANNETIKASPQSRQVYTDHDAHSKELPQFLPKQHVSVQKTLTKQWHKAVVKSKAETLRSYAVLTQDGDQRRNRVPLMNAGTPKLCTMHNPIHKEVS